MFLNSRIKNKILGFVLYTIFFYPFAQSVYYNISLYNNFGVGVVSEISHSSMKGGGTSTGYSLSVNGVKNKLYISYWDNGKNPLGFQMSDTINFRYISPNSVQVLKCNGVEIGSYFQFTDYFSLIMTILFGLGYYYIPQFFKKENVKENIRIENFLKEKNKNNIDDNHQRFL